MIHRDLNPATAAQFSLLCISEIQDAWIIPWEINENILKNTSSHNVNKIKKKTSWSLFSRSTLKVDGVYSGLRRVLPSSFEEIRSVLFVKSCWQTNKHEHGWSWECHTGKRLRWVTQGKECRFTHFYAKLLLNTLHFFYLWTHNFCSAPVWECPYRVEFISSVSSGN